MKILIFIILIYPITGFSKDNPTYLETINFIQQKIYLTIDNKFTTDDYFANFPNRCVMNYQTISYNKKREIESTNLSTFNLKDIESSQIERYKPDIGNPFLMLKTVSREEKILIKRRSYPPSPDFDFHKSQKHKSCNNKVCQWQTNHSTINLQALNMNDVNRTFNALQHLIKICKGVTR